ncbi:non-hydrolyzing UDP-N-acetylglucosamine 2-epimerase [Pirellulaceae bacterium SH449]
MRILLTFGTRPEAIKLAPLIKVLREQPAFDVKVCATGQHREMLDQVLDIFDIHPDFNLRTMTSGRSLTGLTCDLLTQIESVLLEFRPNWILVHGDTSTAMTASLAGFYHKVKVGHVEAGLRTHRLDSPWPEEGNRQIISRLADLHFSPTQTAKANLLRENIPEGQIVVTGNTVIDALFLIRDRLAGDQGLQSRLEKQFSFLDASKKLVLVTSHRRENFGIGLENICRALSELSQNQQIQIIYPVHLNPNVSDPVHRLLSGHTNVFLVPPIDYLSFVYLMQRSYFLLTDSGGVQEEAPSLGKPVLVMRDTTERPEAVAANTVKLVGTDSTRIVNAARELIEDLVAYGTMAHSHNPYGDGQACQRISKELHRRSVAGTG